MPRFAGVTGSPRDEWLQTLAFGLAKGLALDKKPFINQTKDGSFISMERISSSSRNTSVSILFDGFIFNSRELFNDQADAQGFEQLYAQYGFHHTLQLINGDFAVALFDHRRQELYLGRDRFGVRPLYWRLIEGSVAFSSRPWGLAKLGGDAVALNAAFVARYAGGHYRYFDNVPDQSPYRDVFQLPAASWFRFSNDQVSQGSYWALTEEADFTDSEEELAERYRALLLNAVSLRVRKASFPAFTLSGGMDSSSILSCASRSLGKSYKVYSSVYSDKTFDESDDIQAMREGAAQDWNPVLIDNPAVIDLVERMIQAHDEPVATATWLSHYILCKESSSNGHDALFGGLGGDELNAGEYEYFFYLFADLIASKSQEELNNEIKKWVDHHDHPVFRKSRDLAIKTIQQVIDREIPGRCIPDLLRLKKYSTVVNKEFFNLNNFVPVMEAPFTSYLKNRTFQDLTRETVPCCLRAEERQTAIFGMQSIDPFFDYRLVEFMFRVPNNMKIKNGITKILLREAMKGILPEETRTRIKKTGWNAPAHVWFSGEGLDQLYDLVLSQSIRESEIYVQSKVLKILDSHKRIVSEGSKEENHMMFLWQFVNLHCWMKSVL
jgi:asparagine synthase (glutamine-hydrolysing)